MEKLFKHAKTDKSIRKCKKLLQNVKVIKTCQNGKIIKTRKKFKQKLLKHAKY